MRGGRRQPLDVPLDGRVRQHCVFARMPGVFEPCTRLDHLGWLRYLASQTPLFLVASDRSQVARRRSVWILVTSGSLNSNSARLEPLGSKFCPVVMHSPVTGLFAYSWIGFFFHHPSPLPRATYDWAYPIPALHSALHVWSDGLCAKTLGKYCSCTSASVGRASSAPPLDDMRSI